MAKDSFKAVLEQRDRWLIEQIRSLSMALLSQGIFTCTECGEVRGTYILQQGNESQRLPAADTYAMLQFLLDPQEAT